MISKIRTIPQLLIGITENIGHYEVAQQTDKYIVWAEDSEGDSVEGDDGKIHQTIQGTIDYYTKEDMDETVDRIQEALADAKVSFYLNSVQYEDETQYIHFEWVWEVA